MKYTITFDGDICTGVVKGYSVVANKKLKRLDVFANGLIHNFTYDDSGECTIEEWIDSLTKKGKADGCKINLQPMVACPCK